ncbi:LysM peptidoglycan-binding domain-containing protein [Brevirhabdus sp.]|uniref:LysM peptidoglycan-binding domain-containing protein n=1 Tax=Brevirhabdus sp. TaxID=2004514 RepID=UPI00405970B3
MRSPLPTDPPSPRMARLVPHLAPCLAALLAGVVAGGLSTPAAAGSACGVFEAIEPGDTLDTISRRCNVDPGQLLAGNPDIDPKVGLRPGRVLIVGPTPQADPATGGGMAAAGGGTMPMRLEMAPTRMPADAVASASTALPGEAAPEATASATPPPDPAGAWPDLYLTRIQGLWREAGGYCTQPESTWAFGATQMRENTDLCDLSAVEADGQSARIDAVCAGPGASSREYRLQLSGTRMTVQGSIFQTNLERCEQR